MADRTRRGWALCLGLVPWLCGIAHSHEKWLYSSDEVHEFSRRPQPGLFAPDSPALLLAALTALAALCLLALVDRELRRRGVGAALCRRLLSWRAAAVPLLRVATGIVLVHAGLTRTLLAPDLSLSSLSPALATLLSFSQVVLGSALAAGAFTRCAAAGLLVCYAAALPLFGFPSWIDYVDAAGFGIFFLLVGSGGASVDASLFGRREASPDLSRASIALLRVFLGLNLAILAVNNKILHPQVSMAVVADYALNFPRAAGVGWFSDAHYVLTAALVEFVVGVAVALGVAARALSAVVVALLFSTFFVFGLPELVGHLPIVAGAFAILVMGTGGRFRFAPRSKNKAGAGNSLPRLDSDPSDPATPPSPSARLS